VTDRRDTEQLLRELHAARIDGQLARLCAVFADDATFRIAGSSEGKAIAIAASGLAEIRPWLAMLVKTFRLTQYESSPSVIEGDRAMIHWRAHIHSKITGAVVATDLVDMVEVRNGRISAYFELFVPR
jgi:ketosteroid isomerase-like protein